MCWNQYISLNTYLFSMGMLFLMIYNNNYTPYKVNINVYGYFFILSFCSMQLIEYFLWKHIDDKKLNYFYSVIGQLLIAIQPIVSLLMLTNTILKIQLIALYCVFALSIFFTHDKIFKTTTQNGHLKWTWIPIKKYLYFVWFFFLMFSLFANRYYTAIAVAFFLFIISVNIAPQGSGGSLWCWSINFSMIFYAMYLLLYMPFKELNGC